MTLRHVIICGGRDFVPAPDDADRLALWLRMCSPLVVHHGNARGADQWAEHVALHAGALVGVWRWSAKWETEGRAAGPKRNLRMLDGAIAAGGGALPCVVAYPGGRGTAHMLGLALERGCQIMLPYTITGTDGRWTRAV